MVLKGQMLCPMEAGLRAEECRVLLLQMHISISRG